MRDGSAVVIETEDDASAGRHEGAASIDTESAHRLVEALEPGGRFHFRTFADSGNDAPIVQPVGAFDECRAKLERANDRGAGVFAVINRGGNRDADIDRVRAVFVDLDDPEADVDAVRKCALPPHLIIESSPGKHHAYWLADDSVSVDEFASIQRAIAERFGGDRSVTNPSRVMRAPGFVHRKSDPFVSRIVDDRVDDLPRYGRDEIVAEFPPVVDIGTARASRSNDEHDSVAAALNERDAVIRRRQDGGYDVRCPFEDEHTQPGGRGDCTYWPAHTGGYESAAFKCFHNACAERGIRELRDALGIDDRSFDGLRQRAQALTPASAPDEIEAVARLAGEALSEIERERVLADIKHATGTSIAVLRKTANRFARGNRGGITDADEGEHDFTDDGLAGRASREAFVSDWFYVADWRRWMYWDGQRWQADRRLYHLTTLRDYLRREARYAEKQLQMPDVADELRSDKKRSAVERTMRSNVELGTDSTGWDAEAWLLGTPGGTVDLRTGELREARREDRITKQTAVAPAERADAPIWFAFLERIFRQHPELIPFVKRFLGYATTGSTREHKLLFPFGEGRNGKGVTFNTAGGVLGDYSHAAPSAMFLERGGDSHPTDLASLDGARLVTASELPPGRAWDESRIKTMTGGDPITARRMRQDYYTFEPQFSLAVFGNHLPSFRGVDTATRARVLLVPFKEFIAPEERDPELEDKLRGEWPAILRWMIDGALEWQLHGLAPPQVVRDESDQYLESEDMLGEFIGEQLEPDTRCSLPMREVYALFCSWCEQRGVHAWTQHALTKTLRERGYGPKHGRRGTELPGYKLAERPNNEA